MNIRDLDFRSLLILEALVETGNVSQVATQFGMSQPAVSNTLARMREGFKDPLLVRTRGGMLPTVRAGQLLLGIRQAKQPLERMLSQAESADPTKTSRRFTVATTDYAEWIVIPRLAKWLSENAPGIQLEVLPLRELVPFRDLEAGKLELAIGHFNDSHASLYQQHLFTEDFVCLRKPLKGKKKGITLKEYSESKHAIVAPWGGLSGTVDTLLAKKGMRRNVCVSTPHFLMAPWIIIESQYVVTLPRRIAQTYARHLDLEVLELPFPLAPLEFHQLWHERSHEDPAQRWLRGKIQELIKRE